MEAGTNSFSLRQIERKPARLGYASNGKGYEPEDLRNTKQQVFLSRDAYRAG